MTNLDQSSFIEYNNLTKKVELCCNNKNAEDNQISLIIDCSGSYPISSGDNTANFNDVLTIVGSNGGPSAYGTYDMAGQVEEWIDLPNITMTECTDQYYRTSKIANADNFLTNKEMKHRFYLNNGVRLVSSKDKIKIYDKYFILDNAQLNNTANYSRYANWNNSYYGNITDVGTNGRASYYGTFDQNGLVWEWTNSIDNTDDYVTEKLNNQNVKLVYDTYIRGGSWYDDQLALLRDSNTNRFNQVPNSSKATYGFRICSQTGISTDYCSVLVSGKTEIPVTNTCNYNFKSNWISYTDTISKQNTITNLTSVGTNGGPSHYGTFDQDGLVWEITLQKNGDNKSVKYRGGSYGSNSGEIGSQSYAYYNSELDLSYAGFRIASRAPSNDSCYSVVSNAIKNPKIIGSCGSSINTVDDTFFIQRYPYTNNEYITYLNIVDKNGTADSKYYNIKMTNFPNGGILLVPQNNAGSKYVVRDGMGNKPVVGATPQNIARLINWLHNSKLKQPQPSTEIGVYDLNNLFSITVFKNQSNYLSTTLINDIKNVGSIGASSFYGTYDQDGNTWEYMLKAERSMSVGGSYSSLSVGKKTYISQAFNDNINYVTNPNMGSFRIASSYSDPLKYNFQLSKTQNNYFIGIADSGNVADSGNFIKYRNMINYGDPMDYDSQPIVSGMPGNVDYNYSIMKYPVTNQEYTAFLNTTNLYLVRLPLLATRKNENISTDFNNYYSKTTSNVGLNGGPSAYGIYDMMGNHRYQENNISEWNDLSDTSGVVCTRGESKTERKTVSLRDDKFLSTGYNIQSQYINMTFRIASLTNPLNKSNMISIDDKNNKSDTNGYGSVSYAYMINKYKITNQEIIEFYNSIGFAKATSLGMLIGKNSEISYNANISRFTTTKPNAPAIGITWWTAARFCNWLHNNKSASGTENGAYYLSGDYPIRSSIAKYWIPTENEWYKAAYYKGNKLNTGYWTYPTQNDQEPNWSSNVDSLNNLVFLSKIGIPFIDYDPERVDGDKFYVIDDQYKNYPVVGVDLIDVLRFINWLHNDRTNDITKLENGAYFLTNLSVNKQNIKKNSNAKYWLPSLDEWYKAAYYDSKNKKYWNYATQSDVAPERALIDPYYWIPDESEWYKAAYFNPIAKTYNLYATRSNILPSGIEKVDKYGNGPITRLSLNTSNGTLNIDTKLCNSGIVPRDLVHYSYNISRYPITNREYVKYLNINDPSGINLYNLYSNLMSDRLSIMIDETANLGNKYYVNDNMLNKPVIGIDWYKAARYCNWLHNQNSDFKFSNLIPSTEYGVYNILGKNRNEINCSNITIPNNKANIGFFATWIANEFSENNFAGPTSVGTNGGSSYYGTYDQNGNISEFVDGSVSNDHDYNYISDWIRLMGGSWKDTDLNNHWNIWSRTEYNNSVGFRLSSITNSNNFSSFVDVKNPGNDKDPVTQLGWVSYDFKIMEKEFTNNEYINFLNDVDPSGLSSNPDHYNNLAISGLYKIEMTDGYRGGILLNNNAGEGAKYSSKENMGNKPVNFVNWFDAARVCNWLHNGANSEASCLSGVYNISLNNNGSYLRENNASYWISTKNEWYKAAFYDPTKNNNTGGYWKYATQSDNQIMPVAADKYGDGISEFDLYQNTDAKYWIPSEEEWYKAAYHDPNKQNETIEFWNYATQSDTLPVPLTTEHISDSGIGPYSFIGCDPYTPIINNYDIQCGTKVSQATTNVIDFSCFVHIGDVGNAGDENGFGSVGKAYYIQKYPLTNREYVQFLNDVDPNGINTGIFINTLTASSYQDLKSPIRYESGFGYLVSKDSADKPAIGITWYTAARIANWLHNKSNNINNVITGSGAYTLNGATAGIIPVNPNAIVRIPKADEWYKAAYYKRPSGQSENYMRNIANMADVGYWKYPTQNDNHPENFFFTQQTQLCVAPITKTPTPTPTVTPTVTPTISLTPSFTPTISLTPSFTPTLSLTPTITPTLTNTITPTLTNTITPTVTSTPTTTITQTLTPSVTPTVTPTVTVSQTSNQTPTPTLTITPTVTITPSVSPTGLIFIPLCDPGTMPISFESKDFCDGNDAIYSMQLPINNYIYPKTLRSPPPNAYSGIICD